MEQTTLKPWYSECSLDDVRCFIRANLKSVARSVVAVGYYLKSVRDRSLWMDAEQGYESVWDFAQTEFGISKSTASRYMAINDRFSEGGNSPLIMEQYAELSKSQLQEMLYLTDQQAEKVTPDTTVLEIRQMREREPKLEPVEVLEGQMSIEDFEIMPAPTLPEEEAEEVEMASMGVSDICGAMMRKNEPVVMTVNDLVPEEDDVSVAISQQQEKDRTPYLPGELFEMISLEVHNFAVSVRRIIEENPDCDPNDIWSVAEDMLEGEWC